MINGGESLDSQADGFATLRDVLVYTIAAVRVGETTPAALLAYKIHHGRYTSVTTQTHQLWAYHVQLPLMKAPLW